MSAKRRKVQGEESEKGERERGSEKEDKQRRNA